MPLKPKHSDRCSVLAASDDSAGSAPTTRGTVEDLGSTPLNGVSIGIRQNDVGQ